MPDNEPAGQVPPMVAARPEPGVTVNCVVAPPLTLTGVLGEMVPVPLATDGVTVKICGAVQLAVAPPFRPAHCHAQLAPLGVTAPAAPALHNPGSVGATAEATLASAPQTPAVGALLKETDTAQVLVAVTVYRFPLVAPEHPPLVTVKVGENPESGEAVNGAGSP